MEIINIILAVFLIIEQGYLLLLVEFIGEKANTALLRLVFYMAVPALMFHSTSQTSLPRSVNIQVLLLIAGVKLMVLYMLVW